MLLLTGIYFTTSLSYALSYGDHVVIALANIGNPFPVTENPYMKGGAALDENGRPIPNPIGYLGKPCVGGYQSHYVVGEC